MDIFIFESKLLLEQEISDPITFDKLFHLTIEYNKSLSRSQRAGYVKKKIEQKVTQMDLRNYYFQILNSIIEIEQSLPLGYQSYDKIQEGMKKLWQQKKKTQMEFKYFTPNQKQQIWKNNISKRIIQHESVIQNLYDSGQILKGSLGDLLNQVNQNHQQSNLQTEQINKKLSTNDDNYQKMNQKILKLSEYNTKMSNGLGGQGKRIQKLQTEQKTQNQWVKTSFNNNDIEIKNIKQKHDILADKVKQEHRYWFNQLYLVQKNQKKKYSEFQNLNNEFNQKISGLQTKVTTIENDKVKNQQIALNIKQLSSKVQKFKQQFQFKQQLQKKVSLIGQQYMKIIADMEKEKKQNQIIIKEYKSQILKNIELISDLNEKSSSSDLLYFIQALALNNEKFSQFHKNEMLEVNSNEKKIQILQNVKSIRSHLQTKLDILDVRTVVGLEKIIENKKQYESNKIIVNEHIQALNDLLLKSINEQTLFKSNTQNQIKILKIENNLLKEEIKKSQVESKFLKQAQDKLNLEIKQFSTIKQLQNESFERKQLAKKIKLNENQNQKQFQTIRNQILPFKSFQIRLDSTQTVIDKFTKDQNQLNLQTNKSILELKKTKGYIQNVQRTLQGKINQYSFDVKNKFDQNQRYFKQYREKQKAKLNQLKKQNFLLKREFEKKHKLILKLFSEVHYLIRNIQNQILKINQHLILLELEIENLADKIQNLTNKFKRLKNNFIFYKKWNSTPLQRGRLFQQLKNIGNLNFLYGSSQKIEF